MVISMVGNWHYIVKVLKMFTFYNQENPTYIQEQLCIIVYKNKGLTISYLNNNNSD